jgi:hypothetical protein
MKRAVLSCLAVLTVLVTGCPHNDYNIELKPRGSAIERKLVFYRADGTAANGVPNYEEFPSNELAAIISVYPAGSVVRKEECYTADAEFSGAMPSDVGGAGSYTNLSTSLGSAGFYVERFRGNDDLAAQTEHKIRAADQLTDLVIGWSQVELGREAHYQDLRRFLDVDFRRDLKNLSLYSWIGGVASSYKPEASEEFIVRFGQYLAEHGYLKLEDAPNLFKIGQTGGDLKLDLLIQKFVAKKLGISESEPMPQSLAFLGDPEAANKSWQKYLAGTDLYRNKLQQWEKEKQSKPDLKKPEPVEVENDCFSKLLAFSLFSSDGDHLTVKLSLPLAPTHTNGKWDAAFKQVFWDAKLESPDDASRMPVFCYASWSDPNGSFQKKCFGRVALSGDKLLQYCLWRAGLDEKRAGEWDGLLAGLEPGEGLNKKLAAFRFSGEPLQSNTSSQPQISSLSDFPRDLIKTALQGNPAKITSDE